MAECIIRVMSNTFLSKIDFTLLNSTVAVAAVLGIVGFSYYTFTSYQPKSLVEVPEVRGISTGFDSGVPVPTDSLLVSEDSSSSGESRVVKTSMTSADLEMFYANSARIKKWTLVEAGTDTNGFARIYKSEGHTIRINITKSETPDDTSNYVSISVID